MIEVDALCNKCRRPFRWQPVTQLMCAPCHQESQKATKDVVTIAAQPPQEAQSDSVGFPQSVGEKEDIYNAWS